jgi:Asp-tRNA(Asn)/Glu-tRNA(Gln) amidotransferase B subunit
VGQEQEYGFTKSSQNENKVERLENDSNISQKSVQVIVSSSKTIAIFNEKSGAATFKRVHQVSIVLRNNWLLLKLNMNALNFSPISDYDF